MKNRILGLMAAALAFGRDLITYRDKVVPYIATVPHDTRERRIPERRKSRAPSGPQRSTRRVAMDLRDARKRRNQLREKGKR